MRTIVKRHLLRALLACTAVLSLASYPGETLAQDSHVYTFEGFAVAIHEGSHLGSFVLIKPDFSETETLDLDYLHTVIDGKSVGEAHLTSGRYVRVQARAYPLPDRKTEWEALTVVTLGSKRLVVVP
jgi:hypothetical protein